MVTCAACSRTSTSGTYFFSFWPVYIDYDPTTGTNDGSRILTCTGDACRAYTYTASPNRGDYFDGYANPAAPRDVCRYTYHVGDTDGTGLCVPRRDWPGVDTKEPMPITYVRAVPWVLWSDRDFVRAAAIVRADAGAASTSAVTDIIELGPGPAPVAPLGRFGRPRFNRSSLVPGDATRAARLVELGGDGAAYDIRLPETACVRTFSGYAGPPDYGYGLVQWVIQFSADEVLVFSGVQSEASDNQQSLNVVGARAERLPIVSDGPPAYDPNIL